MKITVEISIYPLIENYTGIIISFIKKLNEYTEISVHSTAMSTYISGEYDGVMKILSTELKPLYREVPDSSTILKIIPKDLNIENGFLTF